ncbi:MAG: ribonuclease Y [Lentisphaerae bacterium]|nr:ribonuclease Y [Lentisphaerota bacterium]
MQQALLVGVVCALGGIGAGFLLRALLGRVRADSSEGKAKSIMDHTRREAESLLKEARLQGQAAAMKLREEFDESTKARRAELEELGQRVAEREKNLDRKVAMIDKKEHKLDERTAEVEERAGTLQAAQAEVQGLIAGQRQELQRIAGLSEEEAKKALMAELEKDVHAEMGAVIRRELDQVRETSEREARKIVALAIQRFASSQAAEMTTGTVTLPNDDMKGRIIGRDGRNIRALEAATGVNILIDDTPEAVVISGFDPVRREIARQTLDLLIADGRIHPARIEEVVQKCEENMNQTIREAGEAAAFSVGVQGADPELLRVLGRLKFRTSYTQNVLQHSLEVAGLMGVMAGELGLDITLARRIGLFHDIGKALDHDVEGGHAVIGADLLKRQNESAVLVNAVAAHHEEVEPESIYALLAAAGDAISSSRVGARSETTDIYIKRLERLEAVANGFEGVEKSYAIQAGREVRVIVEPDKVDDKESMVMARDISKKIESELQYPGQIRVMVIRETRCVEYAR